MTDPNFLNRTLFHGDNLDFLRGMNSGTVHLIATDPPFKKGKDFHATPNSLAKGAKFEDRWSWDENVHPDWVDSIKDERPAVWAVIEMARVASEPPGPRMTHAEMKQVLIQNHGMECRGCLRRFDDEHYLQLDHNTPRSDGGLNHISNRLLLCGPCNNAKSNTLTLSGLRALNKKIGWMAKE